MSPNLEEGTRGRQNRGFGFPGPACARDPGFARFFSGFWSNVLCCGAGAPRFPRLWATSLMQNLPSRGAASKLLPKTVEKSGAAEASPATTSSSFSPSNPRFWGNEARALVGGADSGPSARFWVERFMPRGRNATLYEVVGNTAYAKPPTSRRGIKPVAQNREGAHGGRGREAQRGARRRRG